MNGRPKGSLNRIPANVLEAFHETFFKLGGVEGLPQTRFNLEQAKQKLLLCEGKSISPGSSWTFENYEEAKDLIFSPIIPLSAIAKLKEDLRKHEGTKQRITATFDLKSKAINFMSIRAGQKSISTTETGKEMKKSPVIFTNRL